MFSQQQQSCRGGCGGQQSNPQPWNIPFNHPNQNQNNHNPWDDNQENNNNNFSVRKHSGGKSKGHRKQKKGCCPPCPPPCPCPSPPPCPPCQPPKVRHENVTNVVMMPRQIGRKIKVDIKLVQDPLDQELGFTEFNVQSIRYQLSNIFLSANTVQMNVQNNTMIGDMIEAWSNSLWINAKDWDEYRKTHNPQEWCGRQVVLLNANATITNVSSLMINRMQERLNQAQSGQTISQLQIRTREGGYVMDVFGATPQVTALKDGFFLPCPPKPKPFCGGGFDNLQE